MKRKQPAAARRRNERVQYSVRAVPRAIDEALRRRAAQDGTSLNETAIEALRRGLGVTAETPRYHDLDDFIGTWIEDPAFDAALQAQRQIDWELWR